MIQAQKAYISAGTNLGDRKANLEFALNSLAERAAVSKTSSCYETEPVGFLNQPWFLNQVIELKTELAPLDLLSFCQEIETSRGRVRTFRNAPRILDLDILLYGNIEMNRENLVLPHPRLAERRFVLVPLVEIAPDLVHPVLKQSMRSLLQNCRDQSKVRVADGR